jgi:hypothetical protein
MQVRIIKMNKGVYEIFLTSNYVSVEAWQKFLFSIARYIGIFKKFKIIVKIELNEVRYFIETSSDLPTTIGDLTEFLFKKIDNFKNLTSKYSFCTMTRVGSNLVHVYDENEIKYSRKLKGAEISIFHIKDQKYISNTYFLFETRTNNIIRKKIFFNLVPQFLSVDFSSYSRFFYEKAPAYLSIQKSLHLLKSDSGNAIFKIDTFPYLRGDYFLNQNNYNFDKHSTVIGASGTGKSKFISLLIDNIANNPSYRSQYKVIVIDPHSALENDIGGILNTTILNFKTIEDSADLFINASEDIIVSSELILSLLKSLINDQYNSKLERVLRYSIHILLTKWQFNFLNLRKLLLDTEYRNLLVRESVDTLPTSVVDFFLNDFTELKTKSYSEAISPIISFIDEMQLLPIFNSNIESNSLFDILKNNFLTIISLDRIKVGEKVYKTVAGLVMQQIFQLVQSFSFDEQIILVIDEVSSIETPVLRKFLSEARKYGLSLILAQQYFNQISEELRSSMFSNIANYYVFRVSKRDASILEENLMIDIAVNNSSDARIKVLTELNDRECIIRLSSMGMILSALKAKTVDYYPNPKKSMVKELKINNLESSKLDLRDISNKSKFKIGNVVGLDELMASQSTSKKGGRKNG